MSNDVNKDSRQLHALAQHQAPKNHQYLGNRRNIQRLWLWGRAVEGDGLLGVLMGKDWGRVGEGLGKRGWHVGGDDGVMGYAG